MPIDIISTFPNAQAYLHAAEQDGSDLPHLWQAHMIDPFWPTITQWAPFDQSFKQPPCIQDLAALRHGLPLLSALSPDALRAEFEVAPRALPAADEDPMPVYLYPACEGDVVGTSVFGAVLLRVNPAAEDFRAWIPFVFAHEYHHNVWGHYHYVLRQARDVDGTFLEYMVTEGQADLFAESLFPSLAPKWNRPLDADAEKALWQRVEPILASTDRATHELYMFGDERQGLPWCIGYSFARKIVADFQHRHGLSFQEMLAIPAKEFVKQHARE